MDIPLLIITLAVIAGLIVLALFMFAVIGIRADDRHRRPFSLPRSEVEHMTRSVLMYARRKDRPENTKPAPDPNRVRRS
ncbi:hypothetical protein AB0J71_29885 [Nonomuraea sp. NPDC049637]|uniref:hypothetical protein n=1 Tax=Nonomuraea sp. NPDC049637 TaxID=3154356 RepID=UPI00342855F8